MKLKKSGTKLPWLIKQPEQPRHNTDTPFYNSAAWRRASLAARVESPLCLVCKLAGRTEATRVTDHLIPIKFGGSRFDPRNLMAMCKECHNYKSARETKAPLLPYIGTFGEYTPGATKLEILNKLLNQS